MTTTDLSSLKGELRHIATGLKWQEPAADERHTYWTGLHWQLGTAAFWESLAAEYDRPQTYRLGGTLAEEVAACILGGYGLPAADGDAAFQRLRSLGAFEPDARWQAHEFEYHLREPLVTRRGIRRYRFPHQRATRLATAMAAVGDGQPPEDDLELREWLIQIPGIGLKTASWIVRNHRASDRVAIIDIHISRAGMAAGVFLPEWAVERDYMRFEQAFLQWAAAGNVSAAHLDACIWGVLASSSDDAHDILGLDRLNVAPTAVWPTVRG